MKVIISVLILFLACHLLPAQSIESTGKLNSADSSLADGIMTFKSAYNAWNAKKFEEAEKKIEISIKKGLVNHLPHYWKGIINFHLVNYYLWGTKEITDKRKGNFHIDRAIDSLETALKLNNRDPESLTLKGTLYGIKIYQKPYLAPFLGPKVFKLINKGLEIAPKNPRVHYLIGVSYFFTPKYLGGGVKKGLKYLLEADNFFEKEAGIKPMPFEPRWGHSTCLGFIGKAYIKLKNIEEAESYFKKALTINPKDKLAKSGLDELAKQKGK